MNGWSSSAGGDPWGDEPAWVYEITWEWEPLVGQRYPGDPGRRKAVHTPVYEASRGDFGQPAAGPAGGTPPPASRSGTEDQPRVPYAPKPALPDESRGRESLAGARAGAVPPQRDQPSWNRAVAIPDRIPDDRSRRGDQSGRPAAGAGDRAWTPASEPAARSGAESRPGPGGQPSGPDPRRGASSAPPGGREERRAYDQHRDGPPRGAGGPHEAGGRLGPGREETLRTGPGDDGPFRTGPGRDAPLRERADLPSPSRPGAGRDRSGEETDPRRHEGRPPAGPFPPQPRSGPANPGTPAGPAGSGQHRPGAPVSPAQGGGRAAVPPVSGRTGRPTLDPPGSTARSAGVPVAGPDATQRPDAGHRPDSHQAARPQQPDASYRPDSHHASRPQQPDPGYRPDSHHASRPQQPDPGYRPDTPGRRDGSSGYPEVARRAETPQPSESGERAGFGQRPGPSGRATPPPRAAGAPVSGPGGPTMAGSGESPVVSPGVAGGRPAVSRPAGSARPNGSGTYGTAPVSPATGADRPASLEDTAHYTRWPAVADGAAPYSGGRSPVPSSPYGQGRQSAEGRHEAPARPIPEARTAADRAVSGPPTGSPAAETYGSAQPAPAGAFPAYPARPGPERTSDGPFDLRPAPELGTPAPARPAPQPTRVTPVGPASTPAPIYPSVPGQSVPGQSVPSQSVPSQGAPGQSVPSQSMPSQGLPSQSMPSQSVPGQSMSSHGMPSPSMPGGRPAEPQPGGPIPPASRTPIPTQAAPPGAPDPNAFGVRPYGPVAPPRDPNAYGPVSASSGTPESRPYRPHPEPAPADPTVREDSPARAGQPAPAAGPEGPSGNGPRPAHTTAESDAYRTRSAWSSDPAESGDNRNRSVSGPAGAGNRPVSGAAASPWETTQPLHGGTPRWAGASGQAAPVRPGSAVPDASASSYGVARGPDQLSTDGPHDPQRYRPASEPPARPASAQPASAQPASGPWASPPEAVNPVTAQPFAGFQQNRHHAEEASVEPVTAPPANAGRGWAEPSPEPAEAPAAPEPDLSSADDESHGLGWLLAQSGLGQRVPVPEYPTEPEPQPAAEGNQPVAANPFSVATAAPAGDAAASHVAPVSAVPTNAPPTSAAPASAPPTSAAPASAPPTSGKPDSATPISGLPATAFPAHTAPTSSMPTSAAPDSAPPASTAAHGSTHSTDTLAAETPPTSNPPASATPTSAAPARTAADSSTHSTDTLAAETPPTSNPPTSAAPVNVGPADRGWFAPSGAQPIIVPERRAAEDNAQPADADDVVDAEMVEDQEHADAVDGTFATERHRTSTEEPIEGEVVDAEIVDDGPIGQVWVAPISAKPTSDEPIDAELIPTEPVTDRPPRLTSGSAPGPGFAPGSDSGGPALAEPVSAVPVSTAPADALVVEAVVLDPEPARTESAGAEANPPGATWPPAGEPAATPPRAGESTAIRPGAARVGETGADRPETLLPPPSRSGAPRPPAAGPAPYGSEASSADPTGATARRPQDSDLESRRTEANEPTATGPDAGELHATPSGGDRPDDTPATANQAAPSSLATGRPDTVPPTTGQAAMSRPDATTPATDQAGTIAPTTGQPDADLPTPGRPDATPPATGQPDDTRPAKEQPGTTRPTAGQRDDTPPATEQPGTTRPTAGQPDTPPATEQRDATLATGQPHPGHPRSGPAVVAGRSEPAAVEPEDAARNAARHQQPGERRTEVADAGRAPGELVNGPEDEAGATGRDLGTARGDEQLISYREGDDPDPATATGQPEAAANKVQPGTAADETGTAAAETQPDTTTNNETDTAVGEIQPGTAASETQPDTTADQTDPAASDTQPDTTADQTDTAANETRPGRGAEPVRVIGPLRQRRPQPTGTDRRRQDPEQVLASYPVVFHPETLREQIEETDPMWVVVDRLTDKLEYAERDAVRARLLSLRAVAGRLLDDLGPAEADGRAALQHARQAGDLRLLATTQARLAQVLHWKGEFGEADHLYAQAASPELPARLRAEVHELAGRSAFEQGRYLEAMNHFEVAVDLRNGADPEMVERIELALDVITRRTAQGWGPYPRTRAEIIGQPPAPRPLRDERSGLWGYVGAVPPRFAQAQPFADGVAWVRRPEAPAWELIDEAGRLLIDASAGYLAAERFAEGIAWVSRDQHGGWFAIDRQNRVIVPGGFDDAKPFHRGLALVRRGGWGAIDQHGRIVVQPRYRGFATALVAGPAVDGFTDEGLAVVDAGDRYGVVDRAGQLIVAPVHAAVRIHPVAFLIADKYGLWGALDRNGEPMVELKFRDPAGALDEIDRRSPDPRPVL